jgi:hypothetical protein
MHPITFLFHPSLENFNEGVAIHSHGHGSALFLVRKLARLFPDFIKMQRNTKAVIKNLQSTT